MDRIVKNYVEDFLKKQNIMEKDICKQFEFFSAYCAIAQRYDELYDLADVMTGDGDDCGIDAIAILVNGTIVNTIDEIDDLLDVNKKLSNIEFIFVQAKTSPKFNYGDMGTFGAGVKDFCSEVHKMAQNDIVQNKCKILEHIFDNATLMREKPSCYLYYVTTGKWSDDKNCSARIDMVKEDLENLSMFKEVKYIPVDAEKIQKYYRSTIDVIETKIDFPKKILMPDIPNVTQSYLGYIDFKQYIKLITGENGEIRKSVFYDNVRDYQGVNSVNGEIADTIRNEPSKFVLFNNGVTIICKKLSSFRDEVTLVGYQIVNGCQTSHVVFNNADTLKDMDLQINVKLIETDDDETVAKIIKATNRQTAVSDDQLVALNEFHKRLEEYYKSFSGKERLFYERRSKQYAYICDIEKVRIVSIGMQIKTVASMFYDKPHLASRYYGRLMDSIDGIFSDNHSLMPYYTSAYTMYRLEYFFRNKALASKYRKFRYFILMVLKYDLAKGKIPDMNSKNMEKLCDKILDIVNDNDKFIKEIKKITKILDDYVDDVDSTESTKRANLVEQLRNRYI